MVTQIIQISVAQRIVFVNISKWKVYRENFDVDTDLYYGVLQHAINEKWLHSSVKQETKSPISFTLRKKCIQELILCLPVWDWWFPSHEHLYPQGISQEFLWILKAGKNKYQMLNKKKMLTKFSIDKSEIRFGLFHWLLYLVWNSWNLNISFSHFLSQSFNLSSEFTYGCILKQRIKNYRCFLIKYTFKFRNNILYKLLFSSIKQFFLLLSYLAGHIFLHLSDKAWGYVLFFLSSLQLDLQLTGFLIICL